MGCWEVATGVERWKCLGSSGTEDGGRGTGVVAASQSQRRASIDGRDLVREQQDRLSKQPRR